MKPILKIENLSKQYRLGVVGTGTISHDLNRWWHNIRGKEDPYLKIGESNDRATKGASKYVWALKDINLEVQEGEVLGIIGKNGAGKSTLLKILSRVTGPTTGSIKSRGRIASLLEVGTGFHPELTGKENIFLNGAILGMTKAEIAAKLDEIVDFAGVARYIDTPVKRYSSGMKVRLAFAVAAHLEPDILVVDEVLAVGDAEFQKKAIGKMQDISKGQGRTVLFVSHNMAAVKSLCTRAILLEDGKIVQKGETNEIVSQYLKGNNNNLVNYKKFDRNEIHANGFIVNSIGIKNKNKEFSDSIESAKTISLELSYQNTGEYNITNINYRFKNEEGNYIFVTSSKTTINESIKAGKHTLFTEIPKGFFNVGSFFIDLIVTIDNKNAVIMENDIISFTTIPEHKELGTWMGKSPGYLKPSFNWEII